MALHGPHRGSFFCHGPHRGSFFCHGQRIWERFSVHYTPKHGSWLNQAEIELSIYVRQCLGSRRIPSYLVLRSETAAWNRRANRSKITIDWKFTARDARRKFKYRRRRISRSED